MRSIPVDTSGALVMVALPPTVKIKDKRTNEPAVDMNTGEVLNTVSVTFILDGEADVIAVTVPGSGVPDDIKPGALVALTGLVARPWENKFNGETRHGIAFRAIAVTPITPGA